MFSFVKMWPSDCDQSMNPNVSLQPAAGIANKLSHVLQKSSYLLAAPLKPRDNRQAPGTAVLLSRRKHTHTLHRREERQPENFTK